MLGLPPSTQGNYLYIDADQCDQYVYRIMPVQRFLALIETRKNALVKPEQWNDSFENLILRSHFVRKGELVEIAHRDHFFGQCWTLQKASDAMWRIYSLDATGVRIRSTIRKLAKSLKTWRGDWAAQEAYIGKVCYLTSGELLAFGRSVLQCEDGPLTCRNLAATLLVKRPAFSHEREVRLLFTPHDFHNFADPVVCYPIDLHEIVDQVMLDPRLDESEAKNVKAQISAAGFQGAIKRSLLYAPPPDLLVPLKPNPVPIVN